ncbi:MAG TPA: tetratricopeptide repeat protein, partial [Candidatus Kapabacteria bacterium]|nr:tetratricopeptide repeat protein [Candidatus Kapabacteria bacterium]
EQLTKKDAIELLTELRQAEKAGVIREKGFGRFYANQMTAFFGFSHALFHKALYDSLPDAQKQLLHRQCFELLKGVWDRLTETKDRTMSLASKLLTHAEKCGENEFAAGVALAAANAAWETYAEAEALNMLSHVKRLAENTATPLPAKKQDELLGESLYLRSKIDQLYGRFNAALQCATEADTHFERIEQWQRCVQARNQKADVLRFQSMYERSEQEAQGALMLAERIGDRPGIATAVGRLGVINSILTNYEKALTYSISSLEIHESLGNRAGIASAMNTIGNIHQFLGAYEKALDYFARSMEIQESLGDRRGVAIALNNIGIVYTMNYEYEKSLEYYLRSLAIREPIGDKWDIAASVTNIATAYHILGANQKALEYYTRYLQIGESVDDPMITVRALGLIGNIYKSLGEYEKALEYHTRSMVIAEPFNERGWLAEVLRSMGIDHYYLGAYDKALEYLARSIEISESLGNRTNIGRATTDSGDCYCALGLYDKALDAYTRGLELGEQSGERSVLMEALNGIGKVHFAVGECKEALAYFEKAFVLAEELKVKPDRLKCLKNIGNTYRKLGDYRKSRDFLERALALAREMKLKKEEDDVLHGLELLAQDEESQIVINPKNGPLESEDEVFLRNVAAAINENMSDEKFDVEMLAQKVGMSRVQLHRKLRALTDQPASDLIRSMRLDRAMLMLKRNAATVSEAAYAVGFSDPSYFAKCFREKFGMAPSEAGEKKSNHD